MIRWQHLATLVFHFKQRLVHETLVRLALELKRVVGQQQSLDYELKGLGEASLVGVDVY